MSASPKVQSTVRLLMALQTRSSLSVPEMMRLTGVSRQTALRHLASLEDALDLPLEVQGSGPDRRYRLPEGFRRAGMRFSQGDAIALHFGRQLLSFVEGTAFTEWLDQLRDKLGVAAVGRTEEREARFAQRLVFLSEPYRPYDARDEVLGTVLNALLDDRVLALHYASRAGPKRWPRLEPLALVIYRRALYLLARFPRGDQVLRLAVDRIREASRGERFVYPSDFDPRAELADSFGIWDDQGHVDTVRLRFEPRVADLVAERVWHPTARVTAQDDGSALLELEATGPELVRLVLEFGGTVEVLAPQWLRDEVVRELREALARYQS